MGKNNHYDFASVWLLVLLWSVWLSSVLVSHRGVCLSDTVGVVSGQTVSGTATFNNHWSQFQVSANMADDVAKDMVEVMEKRRIDTTLVTMDGLGETSADARLGWGEVTPLWFLSEARGTSGTRRRILPQVDNSSSKIISLTTNFRIYLFWTLPNQEMLTVICLIYLIIVSQ